MAASPANSDLSTAWTLALRELRGGLSGFYVFFACISLGVAAIAGVNSVSNALTAGIAAEGRTILGGDMAFRLTQREATADEYAFLQRAGLIGHIASMRAMSRKPDGTAQTLVELKAVDENYPHAGAMTLEGGGDVQTALAPENGVYGALVAPELLDRLGLEVGERLALGEIELRVADVIVDEPDRLADGIGFGPRLIISVGALEGTGLVRPGSLVRWTYRTDLAESREGRTIAAVSEAATEQFPLAGWRIRSRDNASPRLTRNIERFAQFLTLVGLTALVVGGVGVANAVASFVDLKRPAIATLKCLGAAGSLIFRIYMIQILLLAAGGIAVGLAVGATLPFLARAALAGILPIEAAPGFFPAQLLLAMLYGFLVTVSFAIWPLGRARELPATSLFADRALPASLKPRLQYRIVQGAALVLLTAMAIGLAADKRIAVVFVVAVIAVFLILRLVSAMIVALARRAGSIRGTTLRLAVRNIQRPGALTGSVVLSLGLGLTLLVALALIDTSLRRQLTGTIAEQAPNFFFVDIQNSEKDRFIDHLASLAPEGKIEDVPMLRGRIVSLGGTPSAELNPPEDKRWILRGDRGITYSTGIPKNSELTEGKWWPADYSGEPLVSFEAEAGEAFGLKIGDPITVNVLGREVTARIASFRAVTWETLSINFVMVFSPNTFAGAPHAHLATLALPEGTDAAVDRQVLAGVTGAFPGVTSVRVKDAIDAVNDIVADLALAVRIAASLALLISMLVLGGALAAGHRQRRQDAVVLKALGATRKRLLTAFAAEYGLLGAATALFAVLAGTVAAWYVVNQIMGFEFVVLPWIAISAVLIALTVTIGLGLASTWHILSVKAAPFLRNM
jgi:putative ABC transport system permease protein